MALPVVGCNSFGDEGLEEARVQLESDTNRSPTSRFAQQVSKHTGFHRIDEELSAECPARRAGRVVDRLNSPLGAIRRAQARPGTAQSRRNQILGRLVKEEVNTAITADETIPACIQARH